MRTAAFDKRQIQDVSDTCTPRPSAFLLAIYFLRNLNRRSFEIATNFLGWILLFLDYAKRVFVPENVDLFLASSSGLKLSPTDEIQILSVKPQAYMGGNGA